MDNTLMWIWWSITILLCAWKIGEGFLRPYRMLEWPFLASSMWLYFYGYMAYNAKTQMPEYLGNGMSNIGQFMPMLCLIGLLIGWTLGTRRGRNPLVPDTRAYPYYPVWLAGMFFLIAGAVGAYSVRNSVQTGAANFQEDSGYWFLFFYVGYPGLAMVVWTLPDAVEPHQKYLWIAAVIGLIAFMFPHVADARRGPLFPMILILLLVPPMTTRRSPNPWIFFGSLAVAGVVMLVFLQIREVTYNGGTWSEALHHIDVSTAVTEKADEPEDNEYINNCQLIGTVYGNGKYQYGTGHFGLLWHWVPRAVWKDKPTLGEGSYSFDELFDDVESATGFHLLGHGAAAAGVADSFVQYGVLCPLYWMLLSWGMGAVFARARVGQSPRWLFCYVGFICASHWLVSQGLAAAFVPGMFFQAVPVVVFFLLDPPYRREPVSLVNRRAAGPVRPAIRTLTP